MKPSRLLKQTITLAVLIASFSAQAVAAEFDGYYMDALMHIDAQVLAVSTDMERYLNWGFSTSLDDSVTEEDRKDVMYETSKRAIEDLDGLREFIIDTDFPMEFGKLRDMHLEIIDHMQDIYNWVHEKDPKELEKEFASLNDLFLPLGTEEGKVFEEHGYFRDLPADLDLLNEQAQSEVIKLIDDEGDEALYLEAIELMKNRRYKDAYELLSELRELYIGTPFESCIMLKMSDSLLMHGSDLAEERGLESDTEGLRLLGGIIDKEQYSPVLYEAFYKWRTKVQFLLFGASNMSVIPNQDYNNAAWDILTKVIRPHLLENPDDSWARIQSLRLLTLHNINRRGPFFNSNLNHYAFLYMDSEPDEKKAAGQEAEVGTEKGDGQGDDKPDSPP